MTVWDGAQDRAPFPDPWNTAPAAVGLQPQGPGGGTEGLGHFQEGLGLLMSSSVVCVFPMLYISTPSFLP